MACRKPTFQITCLLLAIRAMFVVHGLNTEPFKDERLPLYIKSLKINAVFKPKTIKLVSIEMLQQIVAVCSALQHPIIYKALYLFGFFSFIRLSNVLSHSSAAFDITRHLTRGKVCPITVLQYLFALIPASKNSTLFVIHRNGRVFPLSDSTARKHLKLISSLLNISPHLTFHSFRRSPTTWAL